MSGKRANIFGQGKPERPYEERDEEAAEVPQRATAAQLATRKIKSAKIRRPAGGASTPSTSANFAAPQPDSFNFGVSAPAVGGNNINNTNGGMFGASSNAFGGGATNSFPPAQSAAPSNTFTSSSFPAFGANSQNTGFNPQPPATDFNFSAAGSSNMFGAGTNAPAMNGNSNGTSAFGGGSMFGSQAPSNPFGGLAQNNTTSASGPGGLFGTTSGAPSTNTFGTTSSAANMTGSPAPAAAPFTFGAPASSSAQTAGTSAPTKIFGAFGASQNNAAPAQNNSFGGFGSNAQNGAQQDTPKTNMFGTASSAQGTQNATATATAPASNLFGFGAPSNVTTSAAPVSNMFGAAGTTSTAPAPNMFATAGTPSSAPASNPFGSLPKPTEPSTPFTFGQPAQEKTPAATNNPFGAIKFPTEAAGTPKPSLFSSVKAPEPTASASSETPRPNLFASLAKPSTMTNSSPGFSFLGAEQNKDTSVASDKSVEPVASKAPETSKPSLFTGFSTPQPAKTAEAEKSKAGLFTAQPKTSTGLFSQTFQPETNNASNAFKTAPSFSGFKSQVTPSAEPSKDTTTQAVPAKEASNPFSRLPAASSDRPTLFTAAKEQAPTPALESSSMSALTSGTELPKLAQAQVPQEWNAAYVSTTQSGDSLFNLISNLTAQLQQLNEKYRAKLNTLSPTADWAALSLWHHQHSSAIKKKIDIAKKQRANAKGVTGNESTVTKRKVNDESPENRESSPSKRARPAETPATPTPQPSTSAPKLNPPATATSSLFAKALNNKPAASSEQPNMFDPKPAQPSVLDPSRTPSGVPGFTPFAGAASPALIGGFKPTLPPASTSGGVGGFKPSLPSGSSGFKPSVSIGSGGFAAQFAASAKTLEQLAAERKKKAMDEDYDSDDETKAEWSARYDKEEAERVAKEKAAVAAAKGFSMSASSKAPEAAKPASNSTANGLFGSRPASPASSTGGSVFDASSTAQTPSSNIFGHLSSRASSNHQDESEDDGEQHPVGSVEPTTPPKRKFGASDNDQTETFDETAKREKSDAAPKGSLLSRMTPADNDGSEKENSAPSLFGQANGTQTPTNKPFNFFDFSAAGSKTAPPKSDTFAGDQTFKHTTPIKFGETAATEKKAAPTFSFQAPSTSTTPSKPPPSSLFNFGSAGAGSMLTAANTGLGSAPSSSFSSRAATPLSEADTSAAEDDEEGGKQEQVDLSKLTAEELASNDVIFETEAALAKHQVDQGNGKTWENFARGPLYILKDKVTGKCFVRIRIASGATPLNYSILPKLKTQVTGSSGKMVQATMPKKEGGISQYYISLKTSEIAQEFSEKYNASLPS